ncbi:hypothetical protein [Streptomyces xiaopingdaonensis]|uniref:hypothetical protein n=1 Tax=Streptomyces xiaopingdaonensis TaxID=1565415 RepID=UPI0002E1742B|nr:hypothetical protein [Streptomyces xiaopingdaonensis]
MHRSLTLRRTAVTTCVALLSFAGGTASASDHPGPRADAPGTQQAAPGYRGAQGFNLCLLARCSLGTGSPGVGLSQTQGGNLCLLATCAVGT